MFICIWFCSFVLHKQQTEFNLLQSRVCVCVWIYQLILNGCIRENICNYFTFSLNLSVCFCFLFLILILIQTQFCQIYLLLRYPRSRVLQVPPSERIFKGCVLRFHISLYYIYFICTINCKGVPASTRPKKITLPSPLCSLFVSFLLFCSSWRALFTVIFCLQNTSLQREKKMFFIYIILRYKSILSYE